MDTSFGTAPMNIFWQITKSSSKSTKCVEQNLFFSFNINGLLIGEQDGHGYAHAMTYAQQGLEANVQELILLSRLLGLQPVCLQVQKWLSAFSYSV